MSNELSNGFVLQTSAVMSENMFTSKIPPKKILLIEGDDDSQVIDNFYFYNQKQTRNYEITVMKGKKKALENQISLSSEGHHVLCLLDRDYSLFLNSISPNKNIFFYPYYELENYILSDEILKKYINYHIKCNSDDIYEKFQSEIESLEHLYSLQIHLKIFVELNYLHKKFDLNEFAKKHISKLSNKSIFSIIQIKSDEYKDKSDIEKIQTYYEYELNKINLSVEKMNEFVKNNNLFINDMIDDINLENKIKVFKYLVDGKSFLNDIEKFIKVILDNCSSLKDLKHSKIPSLSLHSSLIRDWIPNSNVFDELMSEIEMNFS